MSPLEERFLSHVDLAGILTHPRWCAEWTAYRTPLGYGRLILGRGRGRSPIGAHRWAYEHWVGPLIPGLEVCHTCDNPPCVKPEHLWQGTHADNVADSLAKGRASTPPRNEHPRMPLRVGPGIGPCKHGHDGPWRQKAGKRQPYWACRQCEYASSAAQWQRIVAAREQVR